jgi:hypothetical protein
MQSQSGLTISPRISLGILGLIYVCLCEVGPVQATALDGELRPVLRKRVLQTPTDESCIR